MKVEAFVQAINDGYEIRKLKEANAELRAKVERLEEMHDGVTALFNSIQSERDAYKATGALMNEIIKEAQFVLALYLSGAMDRKQVTSDLLGLLDGPECQNAQKSWESANA